MASHYKGLALDWIIGATVVLADSSVARCSETENPELLWALKGAGSNFAIVVSFQFDTFQALDTATPFTVTLPWNSQSQAVSGINALRDFAQDDMPPELNMRLTGNPGNTVIEGVYYGSTSQLQSALSPLLSETGGSISSSRTVGWLDSLKAWSNGEKLDETHPYSLVSKAVSKEVNGTHG